MQDDEAEVQDDETEVQDSEARGARQQRGGGGDEIIRAVDKISLLNDIIALHAVFSNIKYNEY